MRKIQSSLFSICLFSLPCLVTLFCVLTPCRAMDVTFEWNPNTEPDLSGYKVYYKTDTPGEPYDGTKASQGASPINVGDVTEFTLTDLPDGKIYFFTVTAYDLDNLESDYSNVVDALAKPMNQGFNLISLYRQPPNTHISDVLKDISGKYTNVWAYINNSWRAYDPANTGFSDLTTMEPGRGYWLNMKEPATMAMSGSPAASSINLVNGSNLVGYSAAKSLDIADALESINGKYASVWAFIDGSWRAYDPDNPGFSDLTTMAPGNGYWIEATESCTWALP